MGLVRIHKTTLPIKNSQIIFIMMLNLGISKDSLNAKMVIFIAGCITFMFEVIYKTIISIDFTNHEVLFYFKPYSVSHSER